MLSVALPGWLLLCNFFEDTNFSQPHAYLLACFYEVRLKFLRSHVCFHLGDCELCQQYQYSSREMIGHICNLETVEPQEIPIKVYVMFYNAFV